MSYSILGSLRESLAATGERRNAASRAVIVAEQYDYRVFPPLASSCFPSAASHPPYHLIMRIALTGISGFIGSIAARQLHKNGHQITGFVRTTSRRDHVEPYTDRFVIGEQSDDSCWEELLDGADCLVHNSVDWAPIRENDPIRHWQTNLVGSLRLIRAAMPRQVIFISTIAVHHDMRPRWQGVIDEDHPLRPNGLYGAYKAAVEDHLWGLRFKEGLNFAALRPCGVYGIDPRLDRSHGYDLIKRINRNEPLDKPGGGKFVHVEDVAAAIVACVGNPEANAKVVNLVDCYARWADWATYACEIMGVQREIDFSSPSQPKNAFAKDAANALGIALDRGHEGIKQHLRELLERVAEVEA